MIKLVPKDGGNRINLPKEYQLACHKACTGFRDVYGRMAWDEVSPTITSGCTNPSKGRFIHPEQDRAITPREAALLQGFPAKYFFSDKRGKEGAARLIGNAFPPEFARRFAAEIYEVLRVEASLCPPRPPRNSN
jgi:DNA (cytosine-5)-methyltransferase 1